MVDLSAAIAYLERHERSLTDTALPPWSFMLIDDGSGGSVCAHSFSSELVVAYVVDVGDGPVRVTAQMLALAGITEAQLRFVGLANLGQFAGKLKFRRVGRRLMLNGTSNFEASAILVDSIWERPELATFFPNGPIAAIGASNVLVVCDRGDAEEVASLQRSVELIWSTGSGSGSLLGTELYVREQSGHWRAVDDAFDADPTSQVILGVAEPTDAEVAPLLTPPEPQPLPIVPSVAPEPQQPIPSTEPVAETVRSGAGEDTQVEADGSSEAAQAPEAERRRPEISNAMRAVLLHERERTIASAIVACVAALLAALSLVASHAETLYHLIAWVPVALVFGVRALGNLPALRTNPDIDEDPGTTPSTSRLVLAIYSGVAITAAVMAFGSWHAFDDVTFSGFARGGGTYTFVFAGVLGLVVVLGLIWDGLRRPWDSALHALAFVCGTVLVIASVAGSAGGGLSTARMATLAVGLVAGAASVLTLYQAHPDPRSRQSLRVGLIAAGGAAMATSPFFSWGGGTFIVNYARGTNIGGIDGTLTLIAGIAVLVASGAFFFSERTASQHWVLYIRTVTVLSLMGLFGVLSRGLAVPHVGRTFAGVACAFVLLAAVGATDPDAQPTANDFRWRRPVQRLVLGAMAVLATSLVIAAQGRLGSTLFFVYARVDQDHLLFAVTLGAVGVAIARTVLAAFRGNQLAVSAGSLVFVALAALMLIQPSEVTRGGFVSGWMFAVLAACGLASKHWMGGIADDRLSGSRLATVVAANWRRSAVTAAVVWVFMRWGFPLIVEPGEWANGDFSREEYNAMNRQFNRTAAPMVIVPIAVTALVMSRAKDLVATALFVAGAGLIFFEASDAVVAQLDLFDENYSMLSLAAKTTLIGWFSLGRGPFSLPVLLGAVTATSLFAYGVNAQIFFVARAGVPDVVVGEVSRLGGLVEYFALGLVFAAFPVAVRHDSVDDDQGGAQDVADPSILAEVAL